MLFLPHFFPLNRAMSDYIPAFDLNVPLEEDDDGNLPFDLNAPLPEDDNNNGKQQCFSNFYACCM